MENTFKQPLLENYLCEANPFSYAIQNNTLILLPTEAELFWFSLASAALPDCTTWIQKWISLLSTRMRSVPNSPIHLRKVIILLTEIENIIAFASAGALNRSHSRIHPVPLVQPHTDNHSVSVSFIYSPLWGGPHQARGYPAQKSPNLFLIKLGHFPKKLQTRHGTRQSSKPELFFNKTVCSSAKSHAQIIFPRGRRYA